MNNHDTKSHTPFVSIIVPVWNSAGSIKRTIESILAQTWSNLEILLIDDGSDDATNDICREYADKNQNVRYIYQNHAGVSVARNRGIKEANGEYVEFVDADDTIAPETVELLAKKGIESGAEIVICGHQREYYDDAHNITRVVKIESASTGIFSQTQFLNRIGEYGHQKSTGWVNCWDRLISRSFLLEHDIRFPEGISMAEDKYFNIDCISAVKKIAVIQDSLYNYSVAEGRFSQSSACTRFSTAHWSMQYGGFKKLNSLLLQKGFDNTPALYALHSELVNVLIITIYQACWPGHKLPYQLIYKFINEILKKSLVKRALRTYIPASRRESKIMPFLLKSGLPLLIFPYAKRKALRIYGTEAT